jgi:hypothetical protein
MVRCISMCVVTLLAGCAYNSFTPNYDARFGEAVRAATLAQTLNPAGTARAPEPGLEGTSAREAVIRYQDSFKTPPPVVNVINIGGAVSGGQ